MIFSWITLHEFRDFSLAQKHQAVVAYHDSILDFATILIKSIYLVCFGLLGV